MINTFNPYWWEARPVVTTNLPRIDIEGIYKLSTNVVELTETTVDYGINPCMYSRLPNESIILLTIHADIPTGGADLPVVLVVPNTGSSTINNDSSGTSKVSIVDSKGTNVTGANIQGNTERLAYINKCTGTIRFLEFTNS